MRKISSDVNDIYYSSTQNLCYFYEIKVLPNTNKKAAKSRQRCQMKSKSKTESVSGEVRNSCTVKL